MKRPSRIVALGGGTGLPAVLRGLRGVPGAADRNALTAIVTMSDDGGSSGRLRRSRGLPPPGDVRNCLVALSEEEDLLAGLFQHRYGSTDELKGHSVGNLILAALAEQSGSFLKAVEASSRVLRTAGRILPATLDDVRLEASLTNGARVRGETNITSCGHGIRRVSLKPRDARPTPGVLDAIRDADLLVLGPGSLYTSVLPNIVVRGVAKALRDTRGVVVLVANLVGGGETSGLDLIDHVKIINEHAGHAIVDAVLVNDAEIDIDTVVRYEAEGDHPLYWPDRSCPDVIVLRRNLLAATHKLRHDPAATAGGILELWKRVAASAGSERIA